MSDPNVRTKQHQMIVIGCALGGILALSLAGMYFFDRGPTTQQDKPKTVNITAPGSVDDKDAWRAQQAAKEKSNETQINEVKALLKQQQEASTKLSQELDAIKAVKNKAATTSVPPAPVDQQILEQPLPVAPRRLPPDPRPPVLVNGRPGSPATPLNTPLNQLNGGEPRARELEIIRFDGASSARGSNGANDPEKTEVLGFPVDENAKKYGSTKPKDAQDGSRSRQIEFLPAGSFVRASMLNGVDAPTGGQAQSNPLPLALHVIDTANLANKYKLNITDCRFIVAAWGDLSSERTMGRTESLTCIIDGEAVEMQVKGQVIGEDGKAGMRGRLVTKQGQLLANALFAGSLSGIGRAFQAAATTTTTGGAGVTQTIDPEKVTQAGIGGGVSAAANTLAQYYLKAADKLFPVIETDGGRIVEVLITKGAVFTSKAETNDRARGLLSRSGRTDPRSFSDD